MVYKKDISRTLGELFLPPTTSRRRASSGAVKDGWHQVKEFSLYVENGEVLRAMKYDHNGSLVSAQIYVWDPRGRVWINARGTKFSTARNGIYKGTYGVF